MSGKRKKRDGHKKVLRDLIVGTASSALGALISAAVLKLIGWL